MSKEILIGLTGPAGCGKDTVALLCNRHGGFFRYSMAGPLKRGIETMFNLKPSIWEDRILKETDLPGIERSPRYLAQTLGTEWGRQLVHPDVWLLLMMKSWEAVRLSACPRMVISDIRFDNEAKKVLDLGGTVWKVVRETNPVEDHVSERGVSPNLITGRIMNNKSLDDLEARVEKWIHFVTKRYAK